MAMIGIGSGKKSGKIIVCCTYDLISELAFTFLYSSALMSTASLDILSPSSSSRWSLFPCEIEGEVIHSTYSDSVYVKRTVGQNLETKTRKSRYFKGCSNRFPLKWTDWTAQFTGKRSVPKNLPNLLIPPPVVFSRTLSKNVSTLNWAWVELATPTSRDCCYV